MVLPASRQGWRYQIDGEFEYPKGVIGIVVAQKFPDPEIIRVKIEEGLGRVHPETVWIMRDAERKGHAANFAWQTFRSHGIEALLAPLAPGMKWPEIPRHVMADGMGKGNVRFKLFPGRPAADLRAHSRDVEMRLGCERIIVFHDKSSNVTAEWLEYRTNGMSVAKIFVVERGKTKAKTYKKGKALS